MNRIRVVLLFSVALAALFSCAKKSDSKEPDPLKVAMELQYPPFEMSDTDGNPMGISVDMARALGKHLGRPVVIENTAWTGLIPALQTGKVDIILSSMTITEKRAEVVDFSLPYIRAGLGLLIAAGSEVQDFDDLDGEGKVVAVKSGTIGASLAEDRLGKPEVRVFEDVSACVLEVAQGKADAFIYDPLTVYENHKNHQNTTRMNLAAIPGSEGDWGIAVKKGNEELLKKINAFIQDYRDSGGFNEIARSYLGELMGVLEKKGLPFFFDF